MTIRHKSKRRFLWFPLLFLLTIAAFRSNYATAYYSDTESEEASFFAGIWKVDRSTSLETNIAAEGFLEEKTYTVRGLICVTNNGKYPTEGLSILDTIQYKRSEEKFEDYLSSKIDVSEKPKLEPEETYCYAYNIPFEPVDGDKVKYRNSVNVTILNHSGWLPGSNHCEGPDPCPFGPNPKAAFDLPEPVIPVTKLSVEQTASGFIEFNKKDEAFYGAQGEICVTNEGEYDTENLGIYTIIENKLGDKYIEKAARTLNTNEKATLAPGETYCYPFKLSFPDPDENVIEPRVVTTVSISNHTDWIPGDASCPGPDVCYYGPTLETVFEIPQNESESIPLTGAISTPKPGASLSGTTTATGFVEEREGNTVYGVRGKVCVKNEGTDATEALSILDTIQFKTDGNEFEELKSVAIDLSANSSVNAGETYCFPYEILFDPQDGENVQYRNAAVITVYNQEDWLSGDENCPGEEACPFEIPVFADFSLPNVEKDEDEIETPTPEPTETEVVTPEPTETETPTPEPTETETETPASEQSADIEVPTSEPSETETPSPEPTVTESPTPEPTETEPSTPVPEETDPPATTESPPADPPIAE